MVRKRGLKAAALGSIPFILSVSTANMYPHQQMVITLGGPYGLSNEMPDIRRRPYRPAPGLIPEELINRHQNCPRCNRPIQIPWLEAMKFPKHPVEHRTGQGFWIPVSFPVFCDQCEKSFDVAVPRLPNKSNWTLYGDEASRYISDHNLPGISRPLNFFCITLVGLHHKRRARVEKQIYPNSESPSGIICCPDKAF